MTRAFGPLLKTLLFTILVPGLVAGLIPYLLVRGTATRIGGPTLWLGALSIAIGAAIYILCAWEFAVRGLGTPAPIAPTKHLVVTGLHRYVRNPMYIGVFLILLGETIMFRSLPLVAYMCFFCLAVELFVIFYEEPTLKKQFGESYEQYRRKVPRWIPNL